MKIKFNMSPEPPQKKGNTPLLSRKDFKTDAEFSKHEANRIDAEYLAARAHRTNLKK